MINKSGKARVARCNAKLRVGVLVSHPIQYFVPVYRAMAKIDDLDITVVYRTRVGLDPYHDVQFGRTVEWDIPLLGGYHSEFLSRKAALDGFEPAVLGCLLRHRFDVLIVHGYVGVTNLVAIFAAKLLGIRILIRGDTRIALRHLKASHPRRTIKRVIFSAIDGFIAIGHLNREYYLEYGVPEGRVYFAPFCVDNDRFAMKGADIARVRIDRRRSLGVPRDAVVILFVAKLTKQKRPDDLLAAFARVASSYPAAWLVIAGTGERHDELRRFSATNRMERVVFAGFQNQAEMPMLLSAADVFVLPSEDESWGLGVNEAMAAGLPIIVSDEVGCAPDLVAEKGTGIIYSSGNVEELASALERVLSSDGERARMSERAREVIARWSVDECAIKTGEAVRKVFRRVSASLADVQ